MNAPWLFAEAYKYRRLREAFTVSKYWGDYDVFYRQKVTASLPYLFKVTNAIDFVSVTPSLAHQTPSLNYRCASLSPSRSPVNLRRQN
jgi:Damage-control phosphatase ARMT1-like domain